VRRSARCAGVACFFAVLLLACTDQARTVPADQASEFPLRFEMQSTGFVHDTLFHGPTVPATFHRASSGDLLVGPFYWRGPALSRVRPDLLTVEPAVGRGFGPGEATGRLVFAVTPDDDIVVAAPELGRSQVISRSGEVRFSAPILTSPDGVGLCGGRILMTGASYFEGLPEAGVYAADSGASGLTLLHSLQTDTTRRLAPSNAMMTVRGDRAVAAIPNRAEVAVSDRGCARFTRVAIPLPWFDPWSGNNTGGPEVRPHVIDVHWHNDTVALLHIVRANPEARVKKGAGATDAPTARVANVPLFLSDLVAFHVETGRVVAYSSMRYAPYQFTSEGEVARHQFGEIDATELLRLRLVPSR